MRTAARQIGEHVRMAAATALNGWCSRVFAAQVKPARRGGVAPLMSSGRAAHERRATARVGVGRGAVINFDLLRASGGVPKASE